MGRVVIAICLVALVAAMPSSSYAEPKAEEVRYGDVFSTWTKLIANGAALGVESATVIEAKQELVDFGDAGIPHLTRLLLEEDPIDQDRFKELLVQLNAGDFHERERATQALRDMGPKVQAELRQVLKGNAVQSIEVQTRIETILSDLGRNRLSAAERKRLMWIGDVLTEIGSDDALTLATRLVVEHPDKGVAKAFETVTIRVFNTLAEKAIARSRQLLAEGKTGQALASVEQAKKRGEKDGLSATNLNAFLERLEAALASESRLNELNREADRSYVQVREMFLLMLLELNRRDDAAAMLETSDDLRKEFALLLKDPATMKQAELEAAAQAWQRLTERQKTTGYGQALAWSEARSRWQQIEQLANAAGDTEAAKRAAAQFRQSDGAIARLGVVAHVVGIGVEGSAFPPGVLAKQLQPLPEAFRNKQEWAGYVTPTRWLMIGPLPKGAQADDPPRPDETTDQPINRQMKLVASKDEKPQGKTGWRDIKTDFQIVPGMERNCVYYIYTEFQLDKAVKATIRTGCDDTGDLYINGKEVWESTRQGKAWSPTEATVENVQFQAGINRVLFRLENMGGAAGYSFAIKVP